MININKNDKAFKELADFANKVKLPLKEVLLSDEHLNEVSQIFYKHMPTMVKWTVKQDKFVTFYKDHREALVEKIKF